MSDCARPLEQLTFEVPETPLPIDFSDIQPADGSLVLAPRRLQTSPFHPPNFYGARDEYPEAVSIEVDMDTQDGVTVRPGERGSIMTDCLAGCTAAALVVESTDGSRNGHLQHYAPNLPQESVKAFEDAMRQLPVDAAALSVIIMAEGEWQLDAGQRQRVLKTTVPESIRSLLEVIQKHTSSFIQPPKVEICLYPDFEESPTYNGYDSGSLEVEFLEGGEIVTRTQVTPFDPERIEQIEGTEQEQARRKEWSKYSEIYRAMDKQRLFDSDDFRRFSTEAR